MAIKPAGRNNKGDLKNEDHRENKEWFSMRQPIQGKHLGKVTQVDKKTGEQTQVGTMMLMPARAGTCEHCAVIHPKEAPHDATSMFFKYKFYNENGQWPTWSDAMSHCTEEVKQLWTQVLKSKGIDVDSDFCRPKRAEKKKGKKKNVSD